MSVSFLDPVFQFFLGFSTSLVFFLGGLLSFLRCLKPQSERIRKLWTAYKPWLVMWPVCFIVIGIGGQVLIGALFVLSYFCLKEFGMATGLQDDKQFRWGLYSSLCLIYAPVVMNWQPLFAIMPVLLATIFLLIPLFQNSYAQMLRKVGLSLIGILYIAYFPAHLAFLAHIPGSGSSLLFLLIGIALNDAGACIAGRLFGKRLLGSRISPNKTIEGCIGGFASVTVYVALAYCFVPGMSFLFALLSLLLFTIGGTAGDLIMSVFKRDLAIKDMGSVIPGHGGLLDRVDSLLLTAPFYFYLIHYLGVSL